MNVLAYAQAVARLWRVRRDLARLGFADSVARWLGSPGPPGPAAPANRLSRDANPLALARFLHRIGRRLRGSRCLDQSLALTSLLRQQGLPARLVIGAERGGARVSAHAWVELDGQALDEYPEPRARLTVLETWPPR